MSFPEMSLPLGPAVNEISTIGGEMERFAAAGLKHMVFSPLSLMKMGDDKNYCREMLNQSQQCGISLRDAHAPHGTFDSLGVPVPIDVVAGTLLTAIEISGTHGVKTLTIHAGRTRRINEYSADCGEFLHVDLPAAQERILRTLDILLPAAEKNNVILALENLFLPTSTADFLTPIVGKINSPFLGLCYDSGHALLVEKQPGKVSDDIAMWIRCGWEDDTVEFQDFQLEIMKNQVVTTHLHDNDGKNDRHLTPGDGVADWGHIIKTLKAAPRLCTWQGEPITALYEHDAREIVDGFNIFNL